MSVMSSSLVVFLIPVCWSLTVGDRLEENNHQHIFHDPKFWHHFETQVRSRTHSCNFPQNILLDTIEKDAPLYTNADAIFRKRRLGATKWVKNDTMWIEVALGVCMERADGVRGPYSKELQDLHILEAFEDYVDHLDYFQRVASVMAARGQKVQPLSQDSSQVHDIDKLDPVMMVGYSERFEDQTSTSVWDKCVARHTTVNPHHQAHCMWHDCCNDLDGCTFCEDMRNKALREMVCDKVSRRVQKNLGGKMSDEMWDVEEQYFAGMPQKWVDKAMAMMESMKRSSH